jgi:hypothetical protein
MIIMRRTLWAEILKIKGALALRLAILAPVATAGLLFLMTYQRADYYRSQVTDAWSQLNHEMLIFWAMLALPLFITLETALLAELEHGNNQPKHLYALPLPRWTVYATKQLVGLLLIGLSQALLMVLVLLVGWLLSAIKPVIGFEAQVPWARMLRFNVAIHLASWLIISIHTWVGLRWRGFVVAMAVGFVATLGAVMIAGLGWATFYPWVLPFEVVKGFLSGDLKWTVPLVGCLVGIMVAFLGCWEVTRRDVL